MAALPFASRHTVMGSGPILVLAPHADDESLGCGGLIAQACAAGDRAFVAILTDGSLSHPNSKSYPPARLAQLRQAEARDAVATLGLPPDRLSFMGYVDGSAPLQGAPLADATQRLAELVLARGIQTVLTTWEHDPHCDHLSAHRITAGASALTPFRHMAYPVWGLTLPEHVLLPRRVWRGCRLAIDDVMDTKRRAIACHRSQFGHLIDDDPTAFHLPQSLLDLCDRPFETFLEVYQAATPR